MCFTLAMSVKVVTNSPVFSQLGFSTVIFGLYGDFFVEADEHRSTKVLIFIVQQETTEEQLTNTVICMLKNNHPPVPSYFAFFTVKTVISFSKNSEK